MHLPALLAFHNPWWVTGRVPESLALPFRRPVWERILRYLHLNRVIVIKGPRRTGKSTLLFQLMEHLLQSGVPAAHLLYLPFDDPELKHPFSEILREFEKQLGRELSEGPPVYCFFDEIQHLENWSIQLKKYLDKKWPLKFILSGSSASLIRKGAESLVGRTVEEILLPFSFHEFALFHMEEAHRKLLRECREGFDFPYRNIPDRLHQMERKLEILFQRYLSTGGFPELFGIGDPLLRRKLLQEDILEKVIYRDLVLQYGIKKPEVLEKLFLYLVHQSADIFNVSSLANSLKVSREVITTYMRYLQEAYLIMESRRFAPTVESRVRAAPKIHIIDPGILEVFAQSSMGKRVESAVARHLFHHQPEYYRNRQEVDFVVRRGKQLLLMEVKYREQLRPADLSGIKAVQARLPHSQGVIITRHQHFQENGITGIPAHLLLAVLEYTP
ncbi:MAG: ATP-binding protein [Calditrichaeota bacterium]|nr:MAG: ATP-binding protein [Calditrichota bacterium]